MLSIAGQGLLPAPPSTTEEPTGESVAAFLRRHPRFLADHPDLYRVLTPPARVHGEAFADHMAAMVRAGRDRAEGVLAAGRAAAGLAARVQEAVLALMQAGPEHLAECIVTQLPAILAVDAVSLREEDQAGRADSLPPGMVDALLGGRDALIRPDARGADAALLHGEAAALARADALIRVPGRPAALLALARRDGIDPAQDTGQGTGALAFLGRAVAVALGR